MRADVEAVTAGRMSEELNGQRLHQSTVHADGSYTRSWSVVERNRDSSGEPLRYDWQAWRRG
jgi:hypothetical protein